MGRVAKAPAQTQRAKKGPVFEYKAGEGKKKKPAKEKTRDANATPRKEKEAKKEKGKDPPKDGKRTSAAAAAATQGAKELEMDEKPEKEKAPAKKPPKVELRVPAATASTRREATPPKRRGRKPKQLQQPSRHAQSVAPKIPPFTYQQLAVIKAIAQAQNFTEAGRQLYMSQTHVSKEVEKLEKNLDVQLFNRSRGAGNVTLTEAGHLLLRYADRSLTIANEAQVALGDLLNLRTGDLVLGASQTTGTYLMPKVIATFRHRFPLVNVTLQVESTNRVCSAVADGLVDCAVIGGEVPSDLSRDLHTALYRNDELALILSPRHPFVQHCAVATPHLDPGYTLNDDEARRNEDHAISIDDLYDLDIIALQAASTTQRAHEELLTANGIDLDRLNISMELNNIEAIKSAVSCELGAAFVSVMAIEKELKLGTLARVHIDDVVLSRSLQVVTNAQRYRSRALEAFTDLVLPWSSL